MTIFAALFINCLNWLDTNDCLYDIAVRLVKAVAAFSEGQTLCVVSHVRCTNGS